MIGIYKIENKINNKKYIGSAVNIDIRFKRHINDLKKEKHANIYLQREFNKYGLDNFIFECIEVCNKKNLKETEQKYLDDIFSIKECNLYYYNIGQKASGGDNISQHPNKDIIIKKIKKGLHKRYKNENDQDKIKRSNKIKGEKNPNYNHKWNDEQRKRMSDQRKGKHSKIKGKTFEELHGKEKAKILKKQISDRAKKQIGEKNPNYGKTPSKEVREHLSKLFKGKHLSNNNIEIIINDIEYKSFKDAERKLEINWNTIRHRCLSKNPKFSNYNIKGVNKISYTEDEIKNIYRKEKIGRIVTSNNKPFIIDETTFRTLGEASDKLGLHKMTIKTRLLSKNFPNYKYVENENEINVILLEYEKKYLS